MKTTKAHIKQWTVYQLQHTNGNIYRLESSWKRQISGGYWVVEKDKDMLKELDQIWREYLFDQAIIGNI